MVKQHSVHKDVEYSLRGIHDFFDAYPMRPAIKRIEHILIASVSSKMWDKGTPNSLLCFMATLTDLTTAAFVLTDNYSTAGNIAGSEVSKNVITEKSEYFMSAQSESTVWGCWPRSLTFPQYCKPGIVLKEFTNHLQETEWKEVYKSLTGYALSKYGIDEEYSVYEILHIRKQLLQLIEACHLIEVRVNQLKK